MDWQLFLSIISLILLIAAVGIAAVILNNTLSLRRESGEDLENGKKLDYLEQTYRRLTGILRHELTSSRQEIGSEARAGREELNHSLRALAGGQEERFDRMANTLKGLINEFTAAKKDLSLQQDAARKELNEQLTALREENGASLDKMRQTVDENLKDTVQKRFNESFLLISERLEQVHKGLGEMQQLASGVGDLKKVLSNVKTRGNLGEIRLESILAEILSPTQYEAQARVKEKSLERVDFAIRLPDKNAEGENLLLPIDSKFPVEDYVRLMEAYEKLSSEADIKRAGGLFEASVKRAAKDMAQKYINPPITTDFAIMFVPSEGLYAEISRRADLFEGIQRSFKVTVVGPANLAAFLSSLQMGFRTLAIERHSNEVWQLLGAVKSEFGRFGTVLENVRRKLEQAQKEVDIAGNRTKQIERKLRGVEELPSSSVDLLLADNSALDDEVAENTELMEDRQI